MSSCACVDRWLTGVQQASIDACCTSTSTACCVLVECLVSNTCLQWVGRPQPCCAGVESLLQQAKRGNRNHLSQCSNHACPAYTVCCYFLKSEYVYITSKQTNLVIHNWYESNVTSCICISALSPRGRAPGQLETDKGGWVG